jgi:nucleotide-binding universal stress UspA family protein
MLKNILVPLTGFENDANALRTAYVVGWPFDAHVEALHVKPEPMEIVLAATLRQFATKKSNRELVLSLQKEAENHAERAKAGFEEFYRRQISTHAFATAGSGITAEFREAEGNPVPDTIAAARFSDLVVLARAPEGGQFSPDAVANIVVGCGRPVLLVPNAEPGPIGGTVAIAWKEKAEAASAVTAAMPLLTRAKKVLVLSMSEQGLDPAQCQQSAERLAGQLARHGLNVEAHGLADGRHGGPEVLVGKAKELGASLVVSGAYSHSRMRQLMFGGFTRWLLQRCELPVLLFH